jgi:hypothetical protein
MGLTYKAKRKADLVTEIKGNRALYLQQIQEEKNHESLQLTRKFKRVVTRHLLDHVLLAGKAGREERAEIRKSAVIRSSEDDMYEMFNIDPSEAEKVFHQVKADINPNNHLKKWTLSTLKNLVRYEVYLKSRAFYKRETFVQACPNSDCKGMLSQKYKCSTCEVTFCPRCLEPKATGHECNKDLVDTIDLIKATSKKCPKCSERIDKDSGCDQMWCPTCKVAFSWRTGKIETGYIHNPHYFDYMRRTGQAIARAPENQANVDPCRGLSDEMFNELRKLENHFTNINEAQVLYYELCDRIDRTQRPVSVTNAAKTYFRSEDDRSEARLATQLIRSDTIKFKHAELFQIYETAKLALVDIISNLLNDQTPKRAQETSIAVSNLVKYANLILLNFAKLAKLTVRSLPEEGILYK